MIQIADQARNKWASILPMMGIETEHLTGKHGPCPLCGGTDRFRFDNKDGKGSWFCNSCGAGDGFKLLMLKHGRTFAEVADEIRGKIGFAKESAPPAALDEQQAKRALNDLWLGSVPISSDQAAAYLASRGLEGPYPNALRYNSRLPAMIAMVTGPDGKPVNLHRTFLNGTQRTERKIMPGKLPDGSAIRLGEHDGRLGLAEGIETALAVKRDFGITCWSAVNATMMSKFIVPEGVTEFHIYGDNDAKFGGQAAAYQLAHRIATRQGFKVEVHVPEQRGTDWADAA